MKPGLKTVVQVLCWTAVALNIVDAVATGLATEWNPLLDVVLRFSFSGFFALKLALVNAGLIFLGWLAYRRGYSVALVGLSVIVLAYMAVAGLHLGYLLFYYHGH